MTTPATNLGTRTTHTPGPWTARQAGDDWTISWDGDGTTRSPCLYSSWTSLADVYGSDDGHPKINEEGAANARLIAESPALLDLLQRASDYVHDASPDCIEAETLALEIRAAILRATEERG